MPIHPAAVLFLALTLTGCAGLDVSAQTPEPPLRGRVTKVVDGDTIKVRLAARTETVRLIGIDTPETYFGSECGGRAATRAMKRHALTPSGRGRTVKLVTDPTQARRDRYDRLLAYADTLGGTDLGEAVVRDGWAEVYVYDRPFRRLGRYRRAARDAETHRRGVWRACGGDFDRSAG